MNAVLACLRREWVFCAVLLALAGGPHAARADYLVRTFADAASAARSFPEAGVRAAPIGRERLTVYRPLDGGGAVAEEPPEALDADALATAQALALIFAIPPPTKPTGTTSVPVQPHAVPLPPPLVPPGTVPNQGGGNEITSNTPSQTSLAPEPASMVSALVGAGLTGLALWRRKQRRAG